MESSEFIKELGQLNADDLLENYVFARTGNKTNINKVPVYIKRTFEELEAVIETIQNDDILGKALKG